MSTTNGPGEREESFVIQDHSGQRYRVHFLANSHWYLKVWDGPVKAGYANCHIEPAGLYVDDLHIADDALRAANSFTHFLRGLLKLPNKPINYRNRGVGSALLRLIAKLAAERGLAAVEGSLSPHDVAKNPKLLQWYQQRGFVFLPGGRHSAGRVRLELTPSVKSPIERVHAQNSATA